MKNLQKIPKTHKAERAVPLVVKILELLAAVEVATASK